MMCDGADHRRDGHGGFALIEIMFALMLIAVLAALAFPVLVRTTGPAALRVTAFEIAALLRADRNAAQGSGRTIATSVDAERTRIFSGAAGASVGMPAGATVDASGVAAPAVRFFPDGRSSGGLIVIASAGARYTIDVSPDTGAIRVREP